MLPGSDHEPHLPLRQPSAGYNATTFQNDIALLLLDESVSRTPAALPPAKSEPRCLLLS